MPRRDIERDPNVLLAVLGQLVMLAALVVGFGMVGNCAARDRTQGLALVGVPIMIGLACAWTGWHLSTKPTSGRTATALAVGIATGIGAFLVLIFHMIGSCAT